MNELYYDSRMLLIYLAVKYEGDYEKILSALVLKDFAAPYEEAMRVCNSLKCKTITLLDYDYPERLKKVYRPPFVLFYYGDLSLLDKQSIGVVGTRKMNEYGQFCTESLVSKIIKGRVVVSGLARGIDATAHQSAIDNGGRTIAILGTGLDICYPIENKKLYEEIKKNHLLMSEYPASSNPGPSSFPMRNRIIVGLADALYIPQINSQASGTMTSINMALSIGKEVFVAPHPLWSETINNELLNEGATLVQSLEQMMNDLGWSTK